MFIGIVGHESAKFTVETEAAARAIIRGLLAPVDSVLVSGHCPIGGIDIWAEEEALTLGREMIIFPPAKPQWEGGYKQRNLQIAAKSDIVHCIVVKTLPETYKGMRFTFCYHCKTDSHIKSGGCWTALRCPQNEWHIVC